MESSAAFERGGVLSLPKFSGPHWTRRTQVETSPVDHPEHAHTLCFYPSVPTCVPIVTGTGARRKGPTVSQEHGVHSKSEGEAGVAAALSLCTRLCKRGCPCPLHTLQGAWALTRPGQAPTETLSAFLKHKAAFRAFPPSHLSPQRKKWGAVGCAKGLGSTWQAHQLLLGLGDPSTPSPTSW